VFPFKQAPDPQALAEMQKRVEQLQGKKVAAWGVTCSLYVAKPPPAPTAKGQHHLSRVDTAKELVLINFDDVPKKAYLLAKDSVLEADKEISLILEKTKLYLVKHTIEVKGHQYVMGDFVVKIGNVFLKDSAKGSVMEIEYCPSVLPNQSHKVMNELLALLGPFETEVNPIFDFSATPSPLPEVYSPHHTAVQFSVLFKNIGLLPKT